MIIGIFKIDESHLKCDLNTVIKILYFSISACYEKYKKDTPMNRHIHFDEEDEINGKKIIVESHDVYEEIFNAFGYSYRKISGSCSEPISNGIIEDAYNSINGTDFSLIHSKNYPIYAKYINYSKETLSIVFTDDNNKKSSIRILLTPDEFMYDLYNLGNFNI